MAMTCLCRSIVDYTGWSAE